MVNLGHIPVTRVLKQEIVPASHKTAAYLQKGERTFGIIYPG
jgi:hypothetical protein